jgi:hypothetical protein
LRDLDRGRPAARSFRASDTHALFPGQKICQTTSTPRTSSTDNWVTVANQTAIGNPANRVTFNTSLRAGVSGMNVLIDTTSEVESSLNSGLIAAPPRITLDGTHYLQNGYILGASAINSSLIHLP